MRKALLLLLALAMLFTLGACGTAATTGATAAATSAASAAGGEQTAKTGLKVGFLLPTLQSEFFVTYSGGVKKALEEKGYEVTVTSYNGESSKAIEVVENFTVAKMDLIIAMVSDGAVDNALKAAMDKGIKVLVAGVETKYYDVCLVADNADIGNKIGEMAANFVNEKLGGKANVVALSVSAGNADMQTRANSMISKFKELCPNATIVGTPEYTNPGDGTAAVENMLQQYPDIKVVMGYGDAGAIEGVQVLKAAGKTGEDYGVFGCDATEQGLKMIAAGDIFRGTIDMGDIVAQTAEASTQLMDGKLKTPYKWSGTNTQVTSKNIGDYVK